MQPCQMLTTLVYQMAAIFEPHETPKLITSGQVEILVKKSVVHRAVSPTLYGIDDAGLPLRSHEWLCETVRLDNSGTDRIHSLYRELC